MLGVKAALGTTVSVELIGKRRDGETLMSYRTTVTGGSATVPS